MSYKPMAVMCPDGKARRPGIDRRRYQGRCVGIDRVLWVGPVLEQVTMVARH